MHRIRRPIHYLIPTIMTSYEGRWIMNDRPTTCFPYNGKWMHNARIDSGNYVSDNRRNAGKRKQVCLLFKNFRKPSRFRTNEISGYIETFTRLYIVHFIGRNDRPISFVNPGDKVSFSHLDGGIFVIYRIFSRSFEKTRILSGYEKLFLRNSLEKRRFHPCY